MSKNVQRNPDRKQLTSLSTREINCGRNKKETNTVIPKGDKKLKKNKKNRTNKKHIVMWSKQILHIAVDKMNVTPFFL